MAKGQLEIPPYRNLLGIFLNFFDFKVNCGDIYRQPIVAAGGGWLQVELGELERDDLARLDGDGVDAGHVVVVEGALAVREVDQAGRRLVGAPALWG